MKDSIVNVIWLCHQCWWACMLSVPQRGNSFHLEQRPCCSKYNREERTGQNHSLMRSSLQRSRSFRNEKRLPSSPPNCIKKCLALTSRTDKYRRFSARRTHCKYCQVRRYKRGVDSLNLALMGCNSQQRRRGIGSEIEMCFCKNRNKMRFCDGKGKAVWRESAPPLQQKGDENPAVKCLVQLSIHPQTLVNFSKSEVCVSYSICAHSKAPFCPFLFLFDSFSSVRVTQHRFPWQTKAGWSCQRV